MLKMKISLALIAGSALVLVAAPSPAPKEKIKPYEAPLSLELDHDALLCKSVPESMKGRFDKQTPSSQKKDDFVVTSPWDPYQDTKNKPWIRPADTMAGAATRAGNFKQAEPFLGVGVTKPIDTQTD